MQWARLGAFSIFIMIETFFSTLNFKMAFILFADKTPHILKYKLFEYCTSTNLDSFSWYAFKWSAYNLGSETQTSELFRHVTSVYPCLNVNGRWRGHVHV